MNAKEELDLINILDKLREQGVDEALITRLAEGRKAMELINSAGALLMASADQGGTRNFVSLQMVGMNAPFDRMFVELVRPGGIYSSELAAEYRKILDQLLMYIDAVTINAASPDPVKSVEQITRVAAHARERIMDIAPKAGEVTKA